MMQREPAHGHIKGPVFERKVLRIGGVKRNIGNATFFGALFGNRQHGIRQVNADDFSRSAGEGFRDVPRTRRDIKHALVT